MKRSFLLLFGLVALAVISRAQWNYKILQSSEGRGPYPYDLVANGDLDLDGDQDLAVVCRSLEVKWNDGSGRFSGLGYIRDLYNTLDFHSIEVEDMDGDLYPDLVLHNGSAIYYLRNSGSGTFADSVHIATLNISLGSGYSGDYFHLVDFEGDGDMDVFSYHDNGTDKTYVSLNLGAGVFSTIGPLTLYTSFNAVCLADMDNDGDADLLDGSGGVLQLKLNNSGSFTSCASISAAFSFVEWLQAVDIDANGFLDAIWRVGQTIHVAYNSGGCQFALSSITTPWWYYLEPQFIDLNGDGYMDMVGREFGAPGFRVLVNYGGPVFDLANPPVQLWKEAHRFSSVADMNGDGLKDVIIYADDAIVIKLQVSSDHWIANLIPHDYGHPSWGNENIFGQSFPYMLASGDIDSDGVGDFYDGKYVVYPSYDLERAGFFVDDNVEDSLRVLGTAHSTDLNGDGLVDRIVVGEPLWWSNGFPYHLQMIRNSWGSYHIGDTLFRGEFRSIDLDGDGDKDFHRAWGFVCWVYENQNDQAWVQAPGCSMDAWLIGDMTGDGWADHLWVGGGAIALRSGGAGFVLGAYQGMGSVPPMIELTGTAADLDGDGDNDFIYRKNDSLVWCENPPGPTINGPDHTLGGGLSSPVPLDEVVAADAEGDGDLDLFAIQELFLFYYENLGGGQFYSWGDLAAPLWQSDINIGTFVNGIKYLLNDLNGDGFLDIVVNYHQMNQSSLIRTGLLVFENGAANSIYDKPDRGTNAMMLFPNPVTSDELNVRIRSLDDHRPVTAHVFDVSGRAVRSMEVMSVGESFSLSTSDLMPGMYVLDVRQDGRTLAAKRFVVARQP